MCEQCGSDNHQAFMDYGAGIITTTSTLEFNVKNKEEPEIIFKKGSVTIKLGDKEIILTNEQFKLLKEILGMQKSIDIPFADPPYNPQPFRPIWIQQDKQYYDPDKFTYITYN